MKYDEEKLWIAVIERAIKDAAGKNLELKKEAIKWFDSESFETVCELANLSSKRMKSMYGGFMQRKEIKGLLIDNIKECVPYLIPNGNFYRERTYVGNCDGDTITVKIVGKKAGNWRNFTKGTSGDIIDLWTLVKGDINSAKKWLNTKENITEHKVTSFSARHYLNDKSPMPKDIIGPRILTPGGLLVIGGTPKIGKSNFLLSLLAHMASGVPFLNMKPPRPLKIFYLQNEMEYGDMKERLLQLKIDQNLWKENLFITNKMPLTLNSEEVRAIITEKLDAKTVDLIVIDSFLDYREIISFVRSDMEKLRSITNPMAGIVLTHCTKKVSSTVLEKNPFQALSGSNILRSVYTSGIVIFKPNERINTLKVVYELRNSKPMTKYIRKVNGCWKTSKVIATA
ncbi:AAA family ATPase [Wolbachia endosymbiont (group A) of Philonthus cognatus]|uniref:AAA family ATPase n=1 Tax=Wolbachia endosymbiont (group A) of Philonthus cognatus TaxID=2954046 RepID=UPI00222F57DA|nr:AAA family ATPase [Wolbachia endosymbiont (group A) of Philonthus cognatus]